MTSLIKRELIFLPSDSIVIPFPGDSFMVISIFFEIPSVAPLPVAIAFTIEIALWIDDCTDTITFLQRLLSSYHHKELLHRAKSQMHVTLVIKASHNHKL